MEGITSSNASSTSEAENSSLNNVVSSQKSLPTSYDSGWNDPPTWALSSQGCPKPSVKKFLNKRVAFPISSQASSLGTASSTPPNMPSVLSPMKITTAPHKPLVAPTDRDTDLDTATENPTELDFDKEVALKNVLDTLTLIVVGQALEENKRKQLEKRLNFLKNDWLENKLCDTIQKNLVDLSEALKRNDIKEADKIHISLITQHKSVSHWMPAIRHIILGLKNKTAEL